MILVRKNLQHQALVALNYFKSEKFQVNGTRKLPNSGFREKKGSGAGD